jgi:hypothetical protein
MPHWRGAVTVFLFGFTLLHIQHLMSVLFSSASSGWSAALITAVLMSGAMPGWAADPVVSNLKAVQREGTKLVDITYDVAADTVTVEVSLQISGDGGVTFAVPAVSVTGAVGSGVSTGTGKTLTWNAGADWDGQFSPQVRFEEVADDAPDGFASILAGAFSMGDSLDNLDGMGDAPVRVDFSGGDTSKKTPVGNS